MSTARGTTLLVCAAVLAAGCTGPRVASDSAGVSLAGTWKLNTQASDDPQKILAHMREQATKIIDRNVAIQQARIAAGAAAPNDMPGDDPHGPRRNPLAHSPMAHVLVEAAARGEYLTVTQKPDEIVFDYGSSRRSYTPGLTSVVSAENGVADQRSGWSGRDYVIAVKPQVGPQVTETYSLAPDGRRLTDKLHIASYELPAVDLTRVYDLAEGTSTRRLPTD
ncbi:MAG: hypothetical protein JSS29_13650 [Proteobacteria bacterium]|nr:hypothetical protein [Pseudomonadota bacterium]